MMDASKFIKNGNRARLFSTYKSSQIEQRLLSTTLSSLVTAQPLAEKIFSKLGLRIGTRAEIFAYTEVHLLKGDKLSKRPDGFIIVNTGRKTWTALVEAKANDAQIDKKQIENYISLARVNNIDAVITISNELTLTPSTNPSGIKLPKNSTVDLFHLSWASLMTECEMLLGDGKKEFNNDDEIYLVSELLRYYSDKSSGVTGFTQMNKEWPDLVDLIISGKRLNQKDPIVESTLLAWHQKLRDLSLKLSRSLSQVVTLSLSQKQKIDLSLRVKNDIERLINKSALKAFINIPNASSNLELEIQLDKRTITTSMEVNVPLNKKSNTAKLNWVLRQLSDSKINQLLFELNLKNKKSDEILLLSPKDEAPTEINNLGEVTRVRVGMNIDNSKDFKSRKKIVELIENSSLLFYREVGQKLKSYIPEPPKIKKDTEEKSSGEQEKQTVEAPPSWTATWLDNNEDSNQSTEKK